MFVTKHFYLTNNSSHEDYWNKVNNVFVSALALNCLCMHNERMHVHVLECLCGAVYCYTWQSQRLTCVHCMPISHPGVYKHARF